ncbi:MAG: GTPase, partial [Candidatus Woesearchaeota archaeon]
MFSALKKFFSKFLKRSKKDVKLGLYGPPNSGKTTLANRICKDWLGEEMGSVSSIPHETREVQIKEQITLQSKDGKELL